MFSIDGAVVNAISELPGISAQKKHKKFPNRSQKRVFFSEEITSGNFEAQIYARVWRTPRQRILGSGNLPNISYKIFGKFIT